MSTATAVETQLPTRSIVQRGLVALVSALLAVAVVRAVAGLLLAVPPGFEPMQWGAVLGFTAFATLVATVVYAGLDRFTTRTDRNFLVVAVAVTLFMFVPVATVAPSIPGATTGLLGALVALHLVAAIGITAPLVRGTGRGR